MSDLFGGTPLPGRFDKVEKADLTGVTQVATVMDSRDKEMARRFERAENLRRADINEAVGYDLAAIGQFGSEIFQQEANEIAKQIANGDLNPTEARMRLGELKGLYNSFKTHADAMATEDAVAKSYVTDDAARAARNSQLGVGEELNYNVDDYAVDHDTAMNSVFETGSAQKGTEGQWTVIDPTTGQRVPYSQLSGFANPSKFYNYGTRTVDVGTLGNWAQDSATSSSIAFRDGTWDQERAEEFYIDNVLVDDANGRTHRLQLLGTLEDEGLIDHFSDDDKKAFRDGNFIAKEDPETGQLRVFRKIVNEDGSITQGEEIKDFGIAIEQGRKRFVELSRFDGMYRKGAKGGGGSSSDEGFSDKVIRGGYAVPVGQDVNVTNTGAGSGPSEPYNVNRLTDPIEMDTGLATVSGNTQTMDDQGNIMTIAGPSSDGSYRITGAGYSPDGRLVAMVSTEVTRMEPEFGYDDEGNPQGMMVERTSTVNKPIYLTDVNGEAPAAGTQELEIYNTVTQNPDLGPVLRDDRARQSRRILNEVAEQNPNAGTSVPAYIEGTDNATMDRNVDIGAEIQQGLPEDVRSEVEAVQNRARQEEGDVVILPRIEGDNIVFFDKQGRRRNDLGTIVFRSQGPAQRGEAAPASIPSRGQQQTQEERGLQGGRREIAATPQAEAPTLEERREAKKKDKIERLEGRGPRGLTDEDIREMYQTRVAGQEGYRADGIVINVPAVGNSGVTIAGLDIGNAAGGSDVKIDIIAKYVDDPKQIEALRKLKGLERDEADAALKEMQAQGLLTKEALGFTQEDLDNITADYGERSYKDFVRKVGSEQELRNLPPDVVEGMLDVHFNVPGGTTEGPGSPLPELARVLKKKPIKKEDVEKLAQKYDNYWGTEEQVAEKLANDSISDSNVRRTAEAARRLREFGETLT